MKELELLRVSRRLSATRCPSGTCRPSGTAGKQHVNMSTYQKPDSGRWSTRCDFVELLSPDTEVGHAAPLTAVHAFSVMRFIVMRLT